MIHYDEQISFPNFFQNYLWQTHNFYIEIILGQ